MDNQTFLRIVFADRSLKEAIWVCSFSEDPSNPIAPWRGRPYLRTQRLPAENNNFFCISTMRWIEGQVRRRMLNYVGTYCIVLDDVGTKLDSARVVLPGSWMLETSPGNCQVGYILRPVMTDAEEVLRLQLALIQQGLVADRDPGMANVTRYMRLPVGSNTKAKYGNPWQHVLHEWAPERVYSAEQLVSAYKLDLTQVIARGTTKPPPLAAGQTDPYLELLQKVGVLYGAPRGQVYNMLCPWVEHHTDQEITGTAYLSPCGFKCHHGHCQDKTFHDLKNWLRDQGYDVALCDSILRGYRIAQANNTLPAREIISPVASILPRRS